MTIVEILIVAVFWIALSWFILYQNKLNQETKATINELRKIINALYNNTVENEEDKCEIYKMLAILEEHEKNGKL